jgi:pSer/pThr/pTyr-binding forkhead associated (FHA) protein
MAGSEFDPGVAGLPKIPRTRPVPRYDIEVDNALVARFAAACGATAPLDLLIERASGDVITRGSVDRPCALIGREPYCKIVLSDPTVSSRHAILQVIGGRVFVADLDSRSGTRWADRARPDGWLDPDSPIQVGPFRVRLAAPVSDRPTRFDPSFHPLRAGSLPATFPKAAIEFRTGKVALNRWEINRTFTLIGRARSCKINLTSDDVSLYHGYFLLTTDGVWVVDLYGRGGIQVNGQSVRVARLEHGDEVRVARFVLGLTYEGAPPPAARPYTAPLSTARADVSTAFPDRIAAPAVTPPSIVAPPPDEPATPPPADPAGLTLEQLQQSMTQMMEKFDQAHRQQIASIEREMSKLTALTEELQKQVPPAGARPGPAAKPDPTKPPVTVDDAAKHYTLVYERIAALNAERQSLWQRLMKLVSPKTGE